MSIPPEVKAHQFLVLILEPGHIEDRPKEHDEQYIKEAILDGWGFPDHIMLEVHKVEVEQ